jgi:hypothetical protein
MKEINEKRNLVDLETGESFDSVIVPRKKWTPNPYGKQWFMYAQDSAELFMRDENAPSRYRVFFYFLNRLEFNNLVHYSPSEIAEELGLSRSSIWKAIEWLTDKGVIVKGPLSSYRLNENFGWKGNVRDLNNALKNQKQR